MQAMTVSLNHTTDWLEWRWHRSKSRRDECTVR